MIIGLIHSRTSLLFMYNAYNVLCNRYSCWVSIKLYIVFYVCSHCTFHCLFIRQFVGVQAVHLLTRCLAIGHIH